MLQVRYPQLARFAQELVSVAMPTEGLLGAVRRLSLPERERPFTRCRLVTCLTSKHPVSANRVVRGSGILTTPAKRFEGAAAWKRVTPDEMIAHVIGHCSPDTIGDFGVGFYDIDACYHRGIRLEDVVEWALVRLALPDSVLAESIDTQGAQALLSVRSYRTLVAKTILYIWQRGLATSDWERLEAVHPGARVLIVDLKRDSNDVLFDPSAP